jgi:L-alanine-DL-glutamate epimerase-like enolase superfamily enzyme
MRVNQFIKSISVAHVRAKLNDPVIFGKWVMTHREFAVVRAMSNDGVVGWSFGLTRDGTVGEQIRKSITPFYLNTMIREREETFELCKRRNLGAHAAGIGYRALSLVDLAIWDIAARSEDLSMAEFLGGKYEAMLATAIVGYPPTTTDLPALNQQISLLKANNWNRFKIPFSASTPETVEKLKSIRNLAPDSWLGCDGAWVFRTVDQAVEFLGFCDGLNLGWFEDVFLPGDIRSLIELKARTSVRIAMGDDQGGAYYPDALIELGAVDVVRIDATTMGGITGLRKVVHDCQVANIMVAPHMFSHIHSQILSAWDMLETPIEWGIVGSGVDPFADSLEQPVIDSSGKMLPLKEGPGFNNLVNFDWVAIQDLDDPDHIFDED